MYCEPGIAAYAPASSNICTQGTKSQTLLELHFESVASRSGKVQEREERHGAKALAYPSLQFYFIYSVLITTTSLEVHTTLLTMATKLRTLGPKAAAALDEELMSSGAFSIDQLMELAGLAVSQAMYAISPPSKTPNILVACGPGNNGGDGLVAARHLFHFGYKPTMYYPKQSKNELCQRLRTQLEQLKVPFTDDFGDAVKKNDYIIDAIFGFSFSGEVREPFPAVIEALSEHQKPVLAVDAPSSWNIEDGPPQDGPGKAYQPDALISLTAPKPLVKWFKGRHFVGGRFVGREIAEKYGFDVPPYQGSEQIVELSGDGEKL